MGKSSRLEGRKAKAEALASEHKKAERRTTLLWRVGLVVLVVALIAGVVFAVKVSRPKTVSEEDLRSRVTTSTDLGRNHTNKPVDYKQFPPVGGDHNPIWQNCGAYAKAIPEENGVHSLEHGAVWITYDPSLPADQVAALTALVATHPYLLLTPYPGLKSPIVLSAWGVQLSVDSADSPDIPAFLKLYEQGPQTPEPGSACTGGTGTPTVKSA